MSKKNNYRNMHPKMKQMIQHQQTELERLQRVNKELHEHVKNMYCEDHERFIRVMGCVYDHYADDLMTGEQAGNLLLSLIGVWQGV